MILKYTIWLLILVLILSYLGFNIETFMDSDIVKNNLGFIWSWVVEIWVNYIKPIYDFLAGLLGPFINHTITSLQNGGDILTPPTFPSVIPE